MSKKEKKVDKKGKKKKVNIVLIAIIVGAGLLIGVGTWFLLGGNNKEDLKEDTPAVEPTPTPTPTPTLKIVDVNSKSRPYAVMIDNNVGNSNHVGLLDAYLTYEIIVEGGLTRIMAVYKDTNTELIGPIRSSRHYFLDYALENGAIYGHFGWSSFARNDISALKVNNINGMTNGGNAYWRDKSIASPHNVFTSMESLKTRASELGYPLTGDQGLLLNYSIENLDINEKENAVPANQVLVRYSASQTRGYTYDSENKVYLRNMNGSAHVDKLSGAQLSYKNIIIEQVENYTLDKKGHQDLRNIKSGKGYFLTNGYAVPITWSKSARKDKTVYTYADGSEITVNDGRTFIQIVPTTYNIAIE